ncbi:hypothetical protein [Candidatus Nitronereus thalassa]|uniref:Uncharacterized protein n=1 Tax=Candidatus Nitronereus thalassa TaxID=3020898 RepID=A0ABU3K5J2_9BACT|nr:hypothetical protein [Candidatus Nitronereus thalassa]MDT7041618.1 hypothetical protein [Candidatus Nitronereus thalassa]
MVPYLKKWPGWLGGMALLVGCVVPSIGWAVNIGGQVGLADKAKNQPTARVQISGTFRPSTPTGEFDFDQWQIGYLLQWSLMDKEPPPYTETDSAENFRFSVGISVDPATVQGGMVRLDPQLGLLEKNAETNEAGSTQAGTFNQNFDTSLQASVGYRISAGYDGYYTEHELDPDLLLKAKFSLTSSLSISNYLNYIDYWKEGFDAESAGQRFEQQTGNSVLTWEKYFGDGQTKPWLSTAWAPADGIRNDFNWGLGQEHWEGSENNAVTNIAPAQGLSPHTWPSDEDASPVATVYYRRSDHE